MKKKIDQSRFYIEFNIPRSFSVFKPLIFKRSVDSRLQRSLLITLIMVITGFAAYFFSESLLQVWIFFDYYQAVSLPLSKSDLHLLLYILIDATLGVYLFSAWRRMISIMSLSFCWILITLPALLILISIPLYYVGLLDHNYLATLYMTFAGSIFLIVMTIFMIQLIQTSALQFDKNMQEENTIMLKKLQDEQLQKIHALEWENRRIRHDLHHQIQTVETLIAQESLNHAEGLTREIIERIDEIESYIDQYMMGDPNHEQAEVHHD